MVLMRGDAAAPDGWDSQEFELLADPGCPVHGKKWFPILEDDDD
jgi:hypothetical protein